MIMQPRVIDLSHWDPAKDYAQIKAAGIVGVIYKATQGSGSQDATYLSQRKLAKAAGLLWGSYHFGDASNVSSQVDNYLSYADPESDELFCIDFEPNAGNQMSLSQCVAFIDIVEDKLNRPGQCVIYSGNLIKESKPSTFLQARRLWLAQYGNKAILPSGFETYWLWQYTDGEYGPVPHTVPGADKGGVDLSVYAGTPKQLAKEWARGH